MTKNHTVQVSIGAALAGTFKTALTSGSKQLTRLGDSMKKLETRSKGLNSFNKLQGDVQKASSRLNEAEEKVRRLKLEMQKTEKPTKQMQVNLGRARQAANKAKEALKKKRLELGKLRSELNLTSSSSKKLAAEQLKLGATADKLRSKYRLLNESIARRESILSKRSALRGQAFDMIALGAAIGAPIKAAIDFESSMADVRKVIEFKDGKKGLDDLGDKLKELSRTIPLSASELAAIAAAGGQLGETEDTVESFVNVVAKMSTAFDMSAEDAGESIGKIKNVFGLGIDQMESFGDTINHLSDNTAAKAKEIVAALLRVGGPAGDFGLKPDSVAALADTFIALGKPPQQAGTAINALLVKLNTADKQSPKFQAGLAAMGLSASELKDHIAQDAEGALLSFLETVSKVEDQDRAGILFDLFGQEYVDDISLIAGKIDVYKHALGTLADESKRAGSMQREFENRSDTTANKIKLFRNRINELSIALSDGLLPGINFVLGAFGKVFTGIAMVAKTFPLLTTVIFGTIFGLVALKIASIGLAFGWTFVTGGAEMVRAAFIKMRIAALLNNVSFKAFNLTSLVTAIRLKALAFGKVLAVIWGKLAVVASLVKTRLVALNAAALVSSARLKVLNAVSLVTAGRMKLLAAGGMIKAFAGSLLSLATRAIPIVIGGLKALTVAILTNPIGLIIGGIALAAGLVIANWQKVKDFFAGIWEPIKPIWEKFAAFIGKIWDVISAPFKAIGSLLGSLFSFGGEVQANVSTNTVAGDLQPAIVDASSLPSGSTINNSTYNNSFNINVNAAEGQSVKAIADEVIRRIKARSRGALFDQVPGVA